MQSFNFIKRIKFYSVLSFLVPLIAINSCFALYKFFGSFDTFPNFDWEKEKVQYSYDEYNKMVEAIYGDLNIKNKFSSRFGFNENKFKKFLVLFIDLF